VTVTVTNAASFLSPNNLPRVHRRRRQRSLLA